MPREQSVSIPAIDRQDEGKEKRRCVYCGTEAPLVWVHGHGQCAACGINVQECCQGEQCEREFVKK